jgi:hypothetical protein
MIYCNAIKYLDYLMGMIYLLFLGLLNCKYNFLMHVLTNELTLSREYIKHANWNYTLTYKSCEERYVDILQNKTHNFLVLLANHTMTIPKHGYFIMFGMPYPLTYVKLLSIINLNLFILNNKSIKWHKTK